MAPMAAKSQQLPQPPWSRTGVTLFEARQSKSLKVSLPIVGTNVRQFVVDPLQREMGQEPLLQLAKHLNGLLQLAAERAIYDQGPPSGREIRTFYDGPTSILASFAVPPTNKT